MRRRANNTYTADDNVQITFELDDSHINTDKNVTHIMGSGWIPLPIVRKLIENARLVPLNDGGYLCKSAIPARAIREDALTVETVLFCLQGSHKIDP